MRLGDLMQDPFYSSIIFAIESELLEADQSAAAQGVRMTDANIRSVLVKAIRIAEGKPVQPVPDSANLKDRLLGHILADLIAVRESLSFEEIAGDHLIGLPDLPARDWIASLKAVVESCRLREGIPGGRDYLEFLAEFIPRARLPQ